MDILAGVKHGALTDFLWVFGTDEVPNVKMFGGVSSKLFM